MELDGALNLVGAEASGTCVNMAGSSIHDSLDALDVGLPCTVGTSVGVRNLDTKGYTLTTKITLSHSLHLPSFLIITYCAYLRRLDMITDFPEKCKHFFQNFLFFSKDIDIPPNAGYNG